MSDLMVLIGVVTLGYTVSVMLMLAARDTYHKLLDLIWPERCEWCEHRIGKRYKFCSFMCRNLYHWDGVYGG